MMAHQFRDEGAPRASGLDHYERLYGPEDQRALPDSVHVSIFGDVGASKVKTWAPSWPDLVARVKEPTQLYPTKAQMPLIMLAQLGDARTDKGSLRHEPNVQAITGVALDYDGEQVSIADAATLLSEAGITGVFYSSPSSTPERPRWRLLLPASRTLEPQRHRELVGRANAVLRGILAAESFTLAQSYYYIGRAADAVHYEVQEVRGHRCIDQAEDIAPLYPAGANGEAPSAAAQALDDPVLVALREREMLLRAVKAGTYAIRCPWESEHTGETTNSATAYLQPNFEGRQLAGFRCLHGHCAHRTFGDLLGYLGLKNGATASALAPNVQSPQPATANPTEAHPGLRVLSLAELVDYQFPEREEILTPWLLTQSLSMIHAWRGIGKTHVALGIAYAVATGGNFLTWEAKQARRVLYVDGEMPGAALKARVGALIQADERDFDPSYLRIITPDAQRDAPMPDLATVEGQAAVEAAAADADLIILDNISTLYRDAGPENDAESWRIAQGWALKMRRSGKAVLFIHHSGKGGAQRGSSKREDTLDVLINLKRPTDYSAEQGARFELHFEKYRNSSGKGEAKAIEATLTSDANGRACWTWRSVEESTFDRVVALTNDGLKPGEIANELGIHKSQVSRHIKRARGDGKIKPAREASCGE